METQNQDRWQVLELYAELISIETKFLEQVFICESVLWVRFAFFAKEGSKFLLCMSFFIVQNYEMTYLSRK